MIDRMTILIISLVSLFFAGILIFVGFNVESQDRLPVADTGSPDIRQFYGSGEDGGVVRNDPSVIDRMLSGDREPDPSAAPARAPRQPSEVASVRPNEPAGSDGAAPAETGLSIAPPAPRRTAEPSATGGAGSPLLLDRPRDTQTTPGVALSPAAGDDLPPAAPSPADADGADGGDRPAVAVPSSAAPSASLPSPSAPSPSVEEPPSTATPLPPNRAVALAGRTTPVPAPPQQTEPALPASPPEAPDASTLAPAPPDPLGAVTRSPEPTTTARPTLPATDGRLPPPERRPGLPMLAAPSSPRAPAPPASALLAPPPATGAAPAVTFTRPPPSPETGPSLPAFARPTVQPERPAPTAIPLGDASSTAPPSAETAAVPQGDPPAATAAEPITEAPAEPPTAIAPSLPTGAPTEGEASAAAGDPSGPVAATRAPDPSPTVTPPVAGLAVAPPSPTRTVTQRDTGLTLTAPRLESDPPPGPAGALLMAPTPAPTTTPTVSRPTGVPRTDAAPTPLLARPAPSAGTVPSPAVTLGAPDPAPRPSAAPAVALGRPEPAAAPSAPSASLSPSADPTDPTDPAPPETEGPVPAAEPTGNSSGEPAEDAEPAPSGDAQGSAAPVLGLPLACTPGVDCIVQAYTDVDTGPGVADYRCGTRTVDGALSTDFRLLDFTALDRGFPVLAVADGTVLGIRTGAEDMTPAEAEALTAVAPGDEPGNSIIIDHGNGWESQVDHLAADSILVRPGQPVLRGEVIARVGLSGFTTAPQVGLHLRQDGLPVDPFLGAPDRPCDAAASPLWDPALRDALVYRPAAVTTLGLADTAPDGLESRMGRYPLADGEAGLPADSPALVAWVNLIGVEAGDRLTFRIAGPDGSGVFDEDRTLQADAAKFFAYAGRRLDGDRWTVGDYTVSVTLERDGRVIIERSGTVPVGP